MRIHTGDTPYKCTVCHKQFKSQSNLNRHMVLHYGDEPFQCDECDMAVPVSQRDSHTCGSNKTRIHQCDICKKTFKIKCELMNT